MDPLPLARLGLLNVGWGPSVQAGELYIQVTTATVQLHLFPPSVNYGLS